MLTEQLRDLISENDEIGEFTKARRLDRRYLNTSYGIESGKPKDNEYMKIVEQGKNELREMGLPVENVVTYEYIIASAPFDGTSRILNPY
jgi:hypothetical protein